MKRILPLILLGLLCGCAAPASRPSAKAVPKDNPTPPSVTLAWDSSGPGLSYRIYQGPSSRNYTNTYDAGTNLTLRIAGFQRGWTMWFAATAYSTNGLESDFSAEVSYTAPGLPPTPVNLRIEAQSAATPSGPWTTLTNFVVTTTQPAEFFRLQVNHE
jgi:hypothetical protein